MHSGMFGGAAPDALQAMIQILATLRDEDGNTTVRGLDNSQTLGRASSTRRSSSAPTPTVLDGVELVGDGRSRTCCGRGRRVTVLGIDCPPVVGSAAAIPPKARARLNLRVPPGHRTPMRRSTR